LALAHHHQFVLLPLKVTSLSEVVVKSLEGVTDEWQAQLWRVITGLAGCCCGGGGCFDVGGVVSLIDLISWEVGGVNVGRQFGFKWSSNAAKSIKFDTTEELVVLDFIRRNTSETMFRITNKTVAQLA
jgi:hypothetical protein